jgi:ORF6N domain.
MGAIKLMIENKDFEITVKEFNGHRVVTLKDIDTIHERPDGTARRTFASARKHFVEGEDYFVRNTYEAFAEFGLKAPNGLLLFTESGYSLLVKPFTDELAWKVQKQLVKNYFKARDIISQNQVVPHTIEDILISALTSMKEMKLENAELKRSVCCRQ